ncbi:MAG: hypothetical protein V4733_03790 [Verrucomicrobiota bacterium]
MKRTITVHIHPVRKTIELDGCIMTVAEPGSTTALFCYAVLILVGVVVFGKICEWIGGFIGL